VLVFVTGPNCEELALTGTVGAVWRGQPTNHSPAGAFLTFVVMSTLRRRDGSRCRRRGQRNRAALLA
jgi:hypothetical protein